MNINGKDHLNSLIEDLIRYGKVETTQAKGKKIRGVVDRLVGWAKRGDLASRRLIAKKLRDKKLNFKLVDEIAPQLASRSSGFTRLIKLGQRKGDAAPMVRMEFVDTLTAKSREKVTPEVTKTEKIAKVPKKAKRKK